jgi:hypothetical protein
VPNSVQKTNPIGVLGVIGVIGVIMALTGLGAENSLLAAQKAVQEAVLVAERAPSAQVSVRAHTIIDIIILYTHIYSYDAYTYDI